MWRAYQTLSGATGMLVLSVCLVGVAGPSSAERSSPPPTTKCTAGEAAHTLGQDLRPGVLPYLLSKPEAALSLSGHAQYPEYR